MRYVYTYKQTRGRARASGSGPRANAATYWTGSSVAKSLYVTRPLQSPSAMDAGPELDRHDRPRFVPMGFKHLNKETWVVSKDHSEGEYLYTTFTSFLRQANLSCHCRVCPHCYRQIIRSFSSDGRRSRLGGVAKTKRPGARSFWKTIIGIFVLVRTSVVLRETKGRQC